MARCIVCDSTDKWKNVDEYRLKPHNMCICTHCGFVTYPDIISKSKEDLKKYYEEDYRNPPSVNNYFTCQQKLGYHAAFLTQLFDSWKKENKSPNVFEVGCAFGAVLDWIKKNFKDASVSGSEWTQSFRRVAYHEYGINVKEDFDDSQKYDLIVSYKVAEHQVNVDEELLRYRSALKDDGYLYISIPAWFHNMTNFGASGWDIEYYYHKAHINVWTRKLFEGVLSKCGFEIIKENHSYYDETYLCKKGKFDKTCGYEVVDDILKKLSAIKKANDFYLEGKFDKAIEAYPAFPTAHVALYESKRAEFDKKGYDWIKENITDKAIKDTNVNPDSLIFAAGIASRYERYQESLSYLEKLNELKPNTGDVIKTVSDVFRLIANKTKDPKEKYRYYIESLAASKYLRQTNMKYFADATTWLYYDYSQLPMPGDPDWPILEGVINGK